MQVALSKLLARVPLSKLSEQVLYASCSKQVSKLSEQVLYASCSKQVVGASSSEQALRASSPSKFSMQVALSKLLARVPLSKLSEQVLYASCSKPVVGASSSEQALRASSLCKLL